MERPDPKGGEIESGPIPFSILFPDRGFLLSRRDYGLPDGLQGLHFSPGLPGHAGAWHRPGTHLRRVNGFVSDRLFEQSESDWWYTSWQTRQDTLFRTVRDTHEEVGTFRFFYAYKGVLNVGAWSFFAGHMVNVRVQDVTVKGTRSVAYSTSAVDTLTELSSEPIENRYQWGSGVVVPVYGIARRFGRWSLHLQGASILSLQALAAVSLSPIRRIGPHK